VDNDSINLIDLFGLAAKQPFEWHHLFPQLWRNTQFKNISIDDDDMGVLFFAKDHRADDFVGRYNRAWEEGFCDPEWNKVKDTKWGLLKKISSEKVL
jgi:hypothetical protein